MTRTVLLIVAFALPLTGCDQPSGDTSTSVKTPNDGQDLSSELDGDRSPRGSDAIEAKPTKQEAIDRIVALGGKVHSSDDCVDEIVLSETEATDADLAVVRSFDELVVLILTGTRVTDNHVKKLTGLRDLRLSGTSITDAGLDHLTELTDLRTLELNDTAVTDQAVNKLRVALPDCKIYRLPRAT